MSVVRYNRSKFIEFAFDMCTYIFFHERSTHSLFSSLFFFSIIKSRIRVWAGIDTKKTLYCINSRRRGWQHQMRICRHYNTHLKDSKTPLIAHSPNFLRNCLPRGTVKCALSPYLWHNHIEKELASEKKKKKTKINTRWVDITMSPVASLQRRVGPTPYFE